MPAAPVGPRRPVDLMKSFCFYFLYYILSKLFMFSGVFFMVFIQIHIKYYYIYII